MENSNQKTNDELLKLAKRRVLLKKSIKWHALIYLIINVFLCAIYYVTTPGGYFWPMWSIIGWGVGLIMHAIVVGVLLSSTNSKEDAVDKEYQRLQKDADQNNNS